MKRFLVGLRRAIRTHARVCDDLIEFLFQDRPRAMLTALLLVAIGGGARLLNEVQYLRTELRVDRSAPIARAVDSPVVLDIDDRGHIRASQPIVVRYQEGSGTAFVPANNVVGIWRAGIPEIVADATKK